MTDKDEILLEFLAETGVSAPPSVIHWNIMQREDKEWSLDTTRRRLKKLAEKGYVQIAREDSGYRGITDAGRAFLRGDDDASER